MEFENMCACVCTLTSTCLHVNIHAYSFIGQWTIMLSNSGLYSAVLLMWPRMFSEYRSFTHT